MHYLVCYSAIHMIGSHRNYIVKRQEFQLETQPEDWETFLNQNEISFGNVHFILQSDKPFVDMDVIQDN